EGWKVAPFGATTSRSTSGPTTGGAASADPARASRPAAIASLRTKSRGSVAIVGPALVARAPPGGAVVTHVHEPGELRIARREPLHDRDPGGKAQHDVRCRQRVAEEMAARAEPAFHIFEMRFELLCDPGLERRCGCAEPRCVDAQ